MVQRDKKVTHRFYRFKSHNIRRLCTGWRKPHGIDNPMRRRYKGYAAMPKIGYRTEKALRYRTDDGMLRINVESPKDLDMLMMQNSTMAAVISANVSQKTRKAIVERARDLAIKVINKGTRVARLEQH